MSIVRRILISFSLGAIFARYNDAIVERVYALSNQIFLGKTVAELREDVSNLKELAKNSKPFQ